jgi:hypothetical protein
MATFHPFLRLPYELRTCVWKLTVEPRTVRVDVQDYFVDNCASSPPSLQRSTKLWTLPKGLLRVSQPVQRIVVSSAFLRRRVFYANGARLPDMCG